VIAHLAPEFYMYGDGIRVEYSDVVAGIRSSFATLRHFEPGWDGLEVIVLGRDGAVATFTFHDSIVDASGEIHQAKGPTTLVWERRGDRWLITYADADHYPVDDPADP
jgi:ketosteroid isomerase-like protein